VRGTKDTISMWVKTSITLNRENNIASQVVLAC